MKADGNDIEVEVVSIKDEEGNEMESCPHPKQKLKINLGIELEKGDILRVKEQQKEQQGQPNGIFNMLFGCPFCVLRESCTKSKQEKDIQK